MSAAAVIVDERGRILLIHENYGRRRFNLPGGAVEAGETPWQTVIREVAEETMLTIAIDDLIGVYHANVGAESHFAFGFRCRTLSGTPRVVDPAEIAGIAWYAVESWPEPRGRSAPVMVADAMRGLRGVFRDI
jgi:argininosuccinate lyase